jgi:hypothetical protein
MIQYANIFYFITNDIYLVQLIRTTNMNPQFLQRFFCLFTFWVFLQGNWFFIFNALSFYLTKTVLVGPKWFWSDQIDLDLTIMIWSRPKWNGHDQNELVRSKLWFATFENEFGQTKTILDQPKLFWSHKRTRHKIFGIFWCILNLIEDLVIILKK